jgi:hypothetical protein
MTKTWKQKALAATRGTQFGAVLSSAFGKKIKAPCFTSKAIVTSDGFVQANFVDKGGVARHSAFVGSVQDLLRNARGLADHLKLDASERAEFFTVVREWVAVDYSGGYALGALK